MKRDLLKYSVHFAAGWYVRSFPLSSPRSGVEIRVLKARTNFPYRLLLLLSLSPLRISSQRSTAAGNFEAPGFTQLRACSPHYPSSLRLFLASLKLKVGARTLKSNLVAAAIFRKEGERERREYGEGYNGPSALTRGKAVEAPTACVRVSQTGE